MFGLSTIKLALLAAGATVLLGMAGTIWWQHRENGALYEAVAARTAERDAAVQVNRENVAELAAIRLDSQRAIAAIAAELGDAQARAKRTQTIKQEIARATPSEDRPVGPVLSRLLGRLRADAGAAGDADRAGAPGDPARAADLRR